MHDIIAELEARRAKARLGGGEKRISAQHAKGKLTARERLELLFAAGVNSFLDLTKPGECTSYLPFLPADVEYDNRPLTEEEKRLCRALGRRVAETAVRLGRGKGETN